MPDARRELHRTPAWDIEMGKPPLEEQASGTTLFREVSESGIWKVWVILALFYTSLAMQITIRPQMFTDFFAAKRARAPLQCLNSVNQAASVCVSAHADAVWAQAFCDYFSMSWYNFLLAPVLGCFSDRYGRRPFLVAVLAISSAAPVLLALHHFMHLSLYVYFPAQAMIGDGLLLSLSAAAVSDTISTGNRAVALSMNLAGLSLAYILGPIIGGALRTRISVCVAAICAILSVLAMTFIVPETITATGQAKARMRQRTETWTSCMPWKCFSIMMRSRLTILLAILGGIAAFVQAGISTVLPQFLELRLNFTSSDLGFLFTVAGVVGFLTQTVGIRLLKRFIGERGILIFSTIMRLLEVIVFCTGLSKGLMFLGIVFGGLAYLVTVACSSILSKHTAFYEQGNVQGALYGIVCLTSGLACPIFAIIFSEFTQQKNHLPFFPGAPFAFGAIAMLCAIIPSLFVRRKDVQEMEEDRTAESEASYHYTLDAISPSDYLGSSKPSKIRTDNKHPSHSNDQNGSNPPGKAPGPVSTPHTNYYDQGQAVDVKAIEEWIDRTVDGFATEPYPGLTHYAGIQIAPLLRAEAPAQASYSNSSVSLPDAGSQVDAGNGLNGLVYNGVFIPRLDLSPILALRTGLR